MRDETEKPSVSAELLSGFDVVLSCDAADFEKPELLSAMLSLMLEVCVYL